MTPGDDSSSRTRVSTFLLALLIAQSAFHLTWMFHDARIPFWDQGRYFAMTREADRILSGESDRDLVEIFSLHPSHPPLYPIVGVLPLRLGAEAFHGARLVNVLLAACLTLLTYGLGRRTLGPGGACLAATLAAFAPLTASFTHMYYIESLLAPCVVGSLLLLDTSRDLSTKRVSVGVLAGVGCLVKWTYPLFLAGPILAIAFRKLPVRGMLIVAVVATAVAAPWYAAHLGGILDFLSGGVSGGEGHLSAVRGLQGLLYYPYKIVFTGIGLPVALAAAAGMVTLWRRDRRRGWSVLLALAVPLVVFTLVMTKKPRHLLPLLPLLAVLAATCVSAIQRLGVRRALAALLVVHTMASAVQVSFEPFGPAPEARWGGATIPLLTRPSIPGPPDATAWPYDDLISRSENVIPAQAPRQALVLFNLVPFREGGFRYFAAERGSDLLFSLVPFHLAAEGSSFPLERSDEETPGLAEAGLLLAKSGTQWVRYQSGVPAHLHGARIAEALFDPDSPLASCFRTEVEVPLPDGSLCLLLVPSGNETRLRDLAEFALRWDPGLAAGWRVLGEDDPRTPAGRAARLLPAEVAEALQTPDAAARDALLAQAIQREPSREDVWIAVRGLAAKSGELRRRADRVLGLWEAYRVGEEGPRAGLELAREVAPLGDGASIRWLRRTLEGDRRLEPAVAAALESHGLAGPAVGVSLLEHLRTLDRTLAGR